MATTIKPPTICPQCGKALHWMDPQPPAVYCGVCLNCNREYFGTASGQTGSRKRTRRRAAPTPAVQLTPRERDVLHLVAEGLTSAQIAERLMIGLVTVKFHVCNIYSKLGVTSRVAATRYALEQRLVS